MRKKRHLKRIRNHKSDFEIIDFDYPHSHYLKSYFVNVIIYFYIIFRRLYNFCNEKKSSQKIGKKIDFKTNALVRLE